MKYRSTFILAAVLLVFAGPLLAQQWEWASTAFGRYGIDSECVASDSKGCSYVAGFMLDDVQVGTVCEYSFDEVRLFKKNRVDIFLAKYDPAGKVVWAKNFPGGYSISTALGIAIDKDDNIFLSGYFNAPSMTFGSVKLTGGVGYVVEFDAKGVALWGKTFSGECYDVATDNAGNAYVTGFLNGSKVENISVASSDTINFFVARYDPAGTLIWAKGADGGLGRKIAIDLKGNVLIAGTYLHTRLVLGKDKMDILGDNPFLFIAKYDSNGNVMWGRGPREGSGIVPSDIACDSKGNVFVSGSFSSSTLKFGDYSLKNSEGSEWGGYQYKDAFLVKFTPEGNVGWAFKIGSAKDEGAIGVVADENGDVYVAGEFHSPEIKIGETLLKNINTEPGEDSASANIFLAKYSETGTNLWAKGIPTPCFTECLSGMSGGTGNSFFLTGNVMSYPIEFGNILLSHKGANYIFISKFNYAPVSSK